LRVLIENLENKKIKNCLSIYKKLNVKYDCIYIISNCSCIVESILKLDNSNLSLVNLLKILKHVENSANELFTCANITIIKTKFNNYFDENKGLMVFKEISKILQSISGNFNDLSVLNNSLDVLANFNYALITS